MIWLHLCDNLVAGPVIFLHVYPMTHADNPHPLQPGLKGKPIADRSEVEHKWRKGVSAGLRGLRASRLSTGLAPHGRA